MYLKVVLKNDVNDDVGYFERNNADSNFWSLRVGEEYEWRYNNGIFDYFLQLFLRLMIQQRVLGWSFSLKECEVILNKVMNIEWEFFKNGSFLVVLQA